MAQTYAQPQQRQRFSQFYLLTTQSGQGSIGSAKSLVMDMALPQGGVNNDNLFGAQGTGTTDATVGTTVAISHNLGVVPLTSDIQITETSNGTVYLDTANPPTATTFNVLGSAASLTFAWKIVTNGPGNS